jgi:hypothetical protein
MFGLNDTIFRPHNVYGEKQSIADRYRNVVGIFMNQVLKDRRRRSLAASSNGRLHMSATWHSGEPSVSMFPGAENEI